MITYEPDLPSASVNAEVQEAHSLRYGALPFMVLVLSTGRVAVLGHMRDLHAICDTLAEAEEASRSIPMLKYRRALELKEKPIRPSGLEVGTLDL